MQAMSHFTPIQSRRHDLLGGTSIGYVNETITADIFVGGLVASIITEGFVAQHHFLAVSARQPHIEVCYYSPQVLDVTNPNATGVQVRGTSKA